MVDGSNAMAQVTLMTLMMMSCIPLHYPLQLVLSPHLYPRSITYNAEENEDDANEITWRWDLSWGWKSLGQDKTSTVRSPDHNQITRSPNHLKACRFDGQR